MLRLIVVALVGLSLASCVNVVRVRDRAGTAATTTKRDGVPFYIKVERFVHTTAYADTWIRATLTVEKKLVDNKDGKEVLVDVGQQSRIKNLVNAPKPALNAIKDEILRANNADIAQAEAVIRKFDVLNEIDFGIPRNPPIVRNVVDSAWVVDSTKTYYLNAPLPWFGAGNLTQKLAADGTLSEVISAPDTKIGEGLSTLIPFKEYLTGRYVKPAPAAATDPATKSDVESAFRQYRLIDPRTTLTDKVYVYVISLNIEEVGYEYTLTTRPKETREEAEKETPPFSAVASNMAEFTRKEIGGKKDDEKKDEGPEIGISGTINLPKGWGAAKTEE
jgi:hypothetical protein